MNHRKPQGPVINLHSNALSANPARRTHTDRGDHPRSLDNVLCTEDLRGVVLSALKNQPLTLNKLYSAKYIKPSQFIVMGQGIDLVAFSLVSYKSDAAAGFY